MKHSSHASIRTTRTAPAIVAVLTLVALFPSCASPWPDPPPVDQTAYAADYAAWRKGEQETAAWALKIVGIWPLPVGETAFGSESTLSIPLPGDAPPRAGVFTRKPDVVTVTPAAGVVITQGDGGPLKGPTPIEWEIALGSLRLQVIPTSQDRVFVMASDEDHPSVKVPVEIATYAVDSRWRLAARFDAFERPRPVQVPDVRGGQVDYLAMGHLVFRAAGAEQRLTAFGEPGGGDLFVFFKDETNRTTTYGGLRLLSVKSAASDGWTVVDFNLARNPPCAYSRFTTCPLPPPENRLDIAVEAGIKRYPRAKAFEGSGALREQLGLRLLAARAPAEVLVIDRVERPTEN